MAQRILAEEKEALYNQKLEAFHETKAKMMSMEKQKER